MLHKKKDKNSRLNRTIVKKWLNKYALEKEKRLKLNQE
jgi:hypothetical protein